MYTSLPGASAVQAGFSVPLSQFSRATDRNRIKRVTREAWRLNKKVLFDELLERKLQMAVFFVFTAKKIIPFETIQGKISVVLNRLITELPAAPGLSS